MNYKLLDIKTIEKWLDKGDYEIKGAALAACQGRCDIPIEIIMKGLDDNDYYVRREALYACKGRTDVPNDIIIDFLYKDDGPGVISAALYASQGRHIPTELLVSCMHNKDYTVRRNVFRACEGRSDIPFEIFICGMNDYTILVREAAYDLYETMYDPNEFNAVSVNNLYHNIRVAGYNNHNFGTDVNNDLIEMGLKAPNTYIRKAVFNALKGSHISNSLIQRGLLDSHFYVARAAIDAGKDQDITKNTLLKWASYDEYYGYPLNLMVEMGYDIPEPIRDIEPPKLVYKKCINNVIVIAEIPEDANIRGRKYGKCRASKAIIKAIDGDILKDKIGVAMYDQKTLYRVGDEVVITNFDYSKEICSSGFHFFCDRNQAEEYN